MSRRGRSQLFDFRGEVATVTDKAVLVLPDDADEPVWFPRSVIEPGEVEEGDVRDFTVPLDWAEEKGLA